MCHELDLEDRLPTGSATLAPADILLTKLQIFEVNDKDLTDTIALLLSHPVTAAATGRHRRPAGIGRLAKVTRTDWGWHTTLDRQPGQGNPAAADGGSQPGRRPAWSLNGSSRSATRWPARPSR